MYEGMNFEIPFFSGLSFETGLKYELRPCGLDSFFPKNVNIGIQITSTVQDKRKTLQTNE